MFKVAKTLAILVALIAPLTGQPAANAHPLHQEHHGHVHIHRVYYRSCPDSPWVFYRSYHERSHALEAVSFLQARGCDAFCR